MVYMESFVFRRSRGKDLESMAAKGNTPKIRCSFCGRAEEQVQKMISGPNGAYICNYCVEICSEIVEEELPERNIRSRILTCTHLRR